MIGRWLVLSLAGVLLAGALLVGTLLSMPALASEGGPSRPDADTAARVHMLARELRCVVCEGQSVADSPVPLARQMHAVLAEQVAAGATDAEVRAYFVQRYGEQVWLRPALSPRTAGLWLIPAGMLAVLGLLGWRYVRAAAPDQTPPAPQAPDAGRGP